MTKRRRKKKNIKVKPQHSAISLLWVLPLAILNMIWTLVFTGADLKRPEYVNPRSRALIPRYKRFVGRDDEWEEYED